MDRAAGNSNSCRSKLEDVIASVAGTEAYRVAEKRLLIPFDGYRHLGKEKDIGDDVFLSEALLPTSST